MGFTEVCNKRPSVIHETRVRVGETLGVRLDGIWYPMRKGYCVVATEERTGSTRKGTGVQVLSPLVEELAYTELVYLEMKVSLQVVRI